MIIPEQRQKTTLVNLSCQARVSWISTHFPMYSSLKFHDTALEKSVTNAVKSREAPYHTAKADAQEV